jgi:hydroxypyruvate isomerase
LLLGGCASGHASAAAPGAAGNAAAGALKGHIRHSVASWTYGHLSIEQLCQLVKLLGFSAIDLVGPKDWPTLKKHGIDCSMCNGAEINLVDGWSHPEFHPELIRRYTAHIDWVADAGYTNLICFSGNARGMDRETALQNAAKGLAQVLPQAEERGVVLQMELFNSKVDHPDYLADSSAWGIELCKRLKSNHFKLLFDIYHMQIMEGDIIRTIRDNIKWIGHFHTAGNPGRRDMDDTQELNYTGICRAIAATGYQYFVGHEFRPKGDVIEALRTTFALCDVG